jgi:hypothetical protein
MEVLWEEASVVSLKLLNPKVSKSLITVDREGGHTLVDHELGVKELWAKVSVEDLKLPKSEALKPEEPKWES